MLIPASQHFSSTKVIPSGTCRKHLFKSAPVETLVGGYRFLQFEAGWQFISEFQKSKLITQNEERATYYLICDLHLRLQPFCPSSIHLLSSSAVFAHTVSTSRAASIQSELISASPMMERAAKHYQISGIPLSTFNSWRLVSSVNTSPPDTSNTFPLTATSHFVSRSSTTFK